MKVLIWIGCNLSVSILSLIFQGWGIFFGIIVPSQGGAVWLSIWLCKLWDWHQVKKKAAEAGMTVEEYGTHGLSDKFLAKLEELASTVPYEQVKSELKLCVKSGKITKEQYIFLLKKYCNKRY